MVILLSSIYEKNGQWNTQRVQDVMNMWMMSGKEITLLDSEGRQVMDCRDSVQEMGSGARQRMNRMGMMCDWGWSRWGWNDAPPQKKAQSSPVVKAAPSNIEG